MPKINFYIKGKIDGATVEWAIDKQGNAVDVRNMSVYDLLEKLQKRELVLDPYVFLSGKCEQENLEAHLFERNRGENGC
jgi:hypothetical protein